MNFLTKVEAKYNLVYERHCHIDEVEVLAGPMDQLKQALKKTIVPALMMLGPVACGQNPSSDSNAVEKKVEQNLNSSETMSNIKCDVNIDDDGGSIVEFWAKIKDANGKVTNDRLKISFNGANDEVVEVNYLISPRSERMQYFQEALTETFKDFGRSYTQQKYDCTFRLPATKPF